MYLRAIAIALFAKPPLPAAPPPQTFHQHDVFAVYNNISFTDDGRKKQRITQ